MLQSQTETFMNFIKWLGRTLVLIAAISQPVLAKSKATPEMVAMAREAILNMQVIRIAELSIKQGLLQVKAVNKLSPAEKAKLFKIVDAETKKAMPIALDRLARREADRFSQAELNDIRDIAAVPYIQHVVLAAVSKKPAPSESELTPEQTALINKLGAAPHVTKFQDDVLSKNDLAEKELKTVINVAFKKYFK
jgi:hypothetical protein